MTADEIKTLLNLARHPVEGGLFSSDLHFFGDDRPASRCAPASTAIYYLLEPDGFSEMHVLDSDELFHFYLGDPVEMLQLYPDGSSAVFTLGSDLAAGQRSSCWFRRVSGRECGLVGEGKVALLGCTVTPGFDFADYHNASYEELSREMAGRGRADPGTDEDLARATLAEETPQQLGCLLGATSLLHLHLVVELRMIDHREHRSRSTRFRVGGRNRPACRFVRESLLRRTWRMAPASRRACSR